MTDLDLSGLICRNEDLERQHASDMEALFSMQQLLQECRAEADLAKTLLTACREQNTLLQAEARKLRGFLAAVAIDKDYSAMVEMEI